MLCCRRPVTARAVGCSSDSATFEHSAAASKAVGEPQGVPPQAPVRPAARLLGFASSDIVAIDNLVKFIEHSASVGADVVRNLATAERASERASGHLQLRGFSRGSNYKYAVG